MKRLIAVVLCLLIAVGFAATAMAEQLPAQTEPVWSEEASEPTLCLDETLPEEPAPEQTVPEATSPEETIPEQNTPEETTPEETEPMRTEPVPEDCEPDYAAMPAAQLLEALCALEQEKAEEILDLLPEQKRAELEAELEAQFGLWMGFTQEELATFACGYAGGITGQTLLSDLQSLDDHAFRLAVNQMTAAQAGSLEGLVGTDFAVRIASAIIHRGYPAGKTTFTAAAPRMRMAPFAAEPVWPGEGSIRLTKTAAAVPGRDNLWEVTLGIEGKNYHTTSDVVLVIDNSGSMSGTKLANTKKAAKAFADKLLTEGSGTRIAIVTYVASASTNGVFYTYETREQFDAAVDAMQANGGTNQQAGIRAADQLLYSAGSTGSLKNIVLLTDGEATYSYPFTGTAQWTGCGYTLRRHGWNQSTGGKVVESSVSVSDSFDYTTVVGSGSSFSTNNLVLEVTCPHGYTNTVRVSYNGSSLSGGNNGLATIREAEMTKNRGTTIFSVALQAGSNGESVLKACASDQGKGYFAIGAADDVESKLTQAFEAIAGRIAIAASQGRVEDTMGDQVQPVFLGSEPVVTGDFAVYAAGNADVYVSQGSAVYEAETRRIVWTVGNVTEGDNPVMRYRVRIRDGCYPPAGEEIPTNECAYFLYRNYAQRDASAEFPIPMVTVVQEYCSLTITKSGCSAVDAGQSFQFRITGTQPETSGVDLTVVVHGNGSVTVTGLPGGSYRVSESESWSWRYTPEGVRELTLRESENAVTFANTRTGEQWLGGGAWCDNSFPIPN